MARFVPTPHARRFVLGIAGLRVALGLTAVLAPDVALRPWVGTAGKGPSRRVLARSLGARDLALGLGALVAARRNAPIRGWVEAAALADAGDVASTLSAYPHLPRRGRFLVLASAVGAIAAAVLAAPSLS
jgi:hypothetical protein